MKYNIITIEREYASGGSEIGAILSQKLGISCYGEEILDMVAKRRGTTPAQLIHMEESATNSFLYTIAMAAKVATGQKDGLSEESELYMEEAKVIWELTNERSCIIVGRCASWILKERKDVLTIYIHADIESRKKRAVEEYGNDNTKIDSLLRRCDRRRDNFYSANTGKKWDDKTGYHMILDSGKLGIDKCVDIIYAACD